MNERQIGLFRVVFGLGWPTAGLGRVGNRSRIFFVVSTTGQLFGGLSLAGPINAEPPTTLCPFR